MYKLPFVVDLIYNNNNDTRLTALAGTTRVSRYQKGKTNLDLLQQEIVSGSGISWAICKSAASPRHITTPASHHSLQLPVQQMEPTERVGAYA